MSRPVLTASPSDYVATCAALMNSRKVGSVVVVDEGKVVGIFTERDLVRLSASGPGTDWSKQPVSESMHAGVDTVAPDTGISDAFRLITEKGYRHLPIVDGDKLLGIVTMRDLMGVARIQPADKYAGEVPKGLEGLAVADTEIGDVRGMQGFFHYRQYSGVELAGKRTFEDVWHLMFEGRLPSLAERAAFLAETAPLRVIPDEVKPLLPAIAQLGKDFVPLQAAKAGYVLVCNALDFKPWLQIDRSELRAQALRTVAIFPTLVTTLYRLNQGLEPVEPNPDLGHAANYLYMISGEVPAPEKGRAIEQYLMLTIDHGLNASTFTGRVIASTGADLGSAVAGAIGALSGPLHGGAPSLALKMLDEIGSPENADHWLREAVTSGRRLMGFGHRVYKTDDPRAMMLRGVAEKLDPEGIAFAKYIERRAVEILEELKPGRALYPNVEYYAGILMHMIGMPDTLFTPTFGCSRTVGWTAHILEQSADNRLIRPNGHYVGPEPPAPVPDAE
ncbi:MAG TPA: citrate/2-methylcitrate synthase [Actinomycetota bacterium]|nr:citrate/2-methylcitrate synthase [Actinomycetota bacterium]